MAKIDTPDISKALVAGYGIKSKKLDIEGKEEVLAQKKASNEEYGNFLSENSPSSVVNAVDENKDGVIDEEERNNALQATGRKYKAWDTIRDDTQIANDRKQVAANRAASEGRSIRAAQRAEERLDMARERNDLAKNQRNTIISNHRKVGEELGYSGARLDQYVDLAMKDKDVAQAAFAHLEYNDQTQKIVATDETQKQIYLVTKTYTDNYGKGKPEEIEKANIEVMTKLKDIKNGMDIAMVDAQKKGDTKTVAEIKKLKDNFDSYFYKKDGTFNYEGAQKYAAIIAQERSDQDVEMKNQEDKMFFSDYRKTKEKKKTPKNSLTAGQKDAKAYGDAKDTPKEKRTTQQQYTIDKAEGKNKAAATGKQVTEEIDAYLGIQDYSSKKEKEEATKLKIKALKFWKKDKTLTAFEARQMAVEDSKNDNAPLSNKGDTNAIKVGKNKKTLGKSSKKEGSTGTKDGVTYITKNGQWVKK